MSAATTSKIISRPSRPTSASTSADGLEHTKLIMDHLSLAEALARRYRGRGIEDDDLRQVARLGLIRAASRYQPELGDFVGYAVPSITGELRRYFRDHGWLVRPTRRIQELTTAIEEATQTFAHAHGRPPRRRELADVLDAAPEELAAAMRAREDYHGLSIDAPRHHAVALAEASGGDDPGFEAVELSLTLARACRALSVEDRRLLHRRFVREQSQSAIAADLGTNQMAISRRLAAILALLGQQLPMTPAPSSRSGAASRGG